MICTNCGKQIDKDDLFCIYCGNEVVNEQAQQSEVEVSNTVKQEENFNKVQEEKITVKIQEKFENQVSKAQNGLEKVKNKTEIMREKTRLSSAINDVQVKKAKALAELGLLTYEKLRTNQFKDEELMDVCKSILGFDYIIYDNSMKIEELERSIQSITCKCGSVINEESKFCTGCGGKVEIPVDSRVFTNCGICEAKIEEGSNFCPCCGNKL